MDAQSMDKRGCSSNSLQDPVTKPVAKKRFFSKSNGEKTMKFQMNLKGDIKFFLDRGPPALPAAKVSQTLPEKKTKPIARKKFFTSTNRDDNRHQMNVKKYINPVQTVLRDNNEKKRLKPAAPEAKPFLSPTDSHTPLEACDSIEVRRVNNRGNNQFHKPLLSEYESKNPQSPCNNVGPMGVSIAEESGTESGKDVDMEETIITNPEEIPEVRQNETNNVHEDNKIDHINNVEDKFSNCDDTIIVAKDVELMEESPVVNTIPQLNELDMSAESRSSSQPLPSTVVTEEVFGASSQPLPEQIPKLIPKKKFFSKSNAHKQRTNVNVKNFFNPNHTVLEPDEIDFKAPETKSGSNNFDFDDEVKIRRVKKAHQCHELGESEQFDGDIKFYLDGLCARNPVNTRCLSIIGLANMALKAEFRMHLRANDDMPKIMKALLDAPKDCNLALCTAALLYVYNQDRLTMDIDPNALSLMLELLETRTDEYSSVDKRHYDKVKDLCTVMKGKGHGKYLKVEGVYIKAGKLALESLLGLTSKRAGDWFKEEIRVLKGCDFLMNTVIDALITESDLRKDEGLLNKVDRTLKVIENLTFAHEENQRYVIEYENGNFIHTCIKLIRFTKLSILTLSESSNYLSALLSVLRLLTNLSSESAFACQAIGSLDSSLFELLLDLVFELPSFILPESRFDLIILLLCLGINMVEFCPPIRNSFMASEPACSRLIELFLERYIEAQKVDQSADDLLDEQEKKQSQELDMDSLLMQVLAKSGKHMEHSIIAACISLLIGCGIHEDQEAMDRIRDMLPEASFGQMVDVLTKLQEFAHLADIMTPSGVKRVERILRVFKSSSLSQSSSICHNESSLPSFSIIDDTESSFQQDTSFL